VACNNVTPNRYTCPALVNVAMNFGIPLNSKISWIAEKLFVSDRTLLHVIILLDL